MMFAIGFMCGMLVNTLVILGTALVNEKREDELLDIRDPSHRMM